MSAVATLSAAAIATPAAITAVFSPSKHPFMRRVMGAPTHFSFDPYKVARSQLGMMNVASAATTGMTAASSSASVVSSATTVSSASSCATANFFVAAAAAAAAVSTVPAPAVVATKAASPAKVATLPYRIATIQFKQGIANFRANFRVAEGDVVIVEGDRGEHIGTVKKIHNAAETEALVAEAPVAAKIVRRATAADKEALDQQRVKETSVHEEVSKIAKDLKLNATITDVEFQFDNNKLTIFVERASSTTFVDFRRVQRSLFKMFHCRIWFVYMDELNQ